MNDQPNSSEPTAEELQEKIKEDKKKREKQNERTYKRLIKIQKIIEKLHENRYISDDINLELTRHLDYLLRKNPDYEASLIRKITKKATKKKVEKEQELPIIKMKNVMGNTNVPKIQKEGDAGADAYINTFVKIHHDGSVEAIQDNEVKLNPLRRIGCMLGFATEIPFGCYAQIVPRSGLALKYGITILNAPATIDSGYRGEWMAIVVNVSNRAVRIKKNERICQIIIRRLVPYEIKMVNSLGQSNRGEGGFGSTGTE
jgi:dUTP pyrophosphatase